MNNKQKLTYDFLKFIIKNYGIWLTITKSNGKKV